MGEDESPGYFPIISDLENNESLAMRYRDDWDVKPVAAAPLRPRRAQAEIDTEAGLFGTDNSFKASKNGQMRLFSSAAPGDFRRDLISSFPKPPSEYTYEPYDERRPIIRKALDDRRLVAWRPTDPSGATRRFEEVSGVAVVYFTGGAETLGGFTSKDFADVIFIRADRSDVPTAWLLAHELTHVAQKDTRVDTGGLLRDVISLLAPGELESIQQKLSEKYPKVEWDNEVTAHLMGEAVTGKNIFGLFDLTNSEAIQTRLLETFDSLPVLKPEALESAPDDELARLLSSAPQPDFDPVQMALEKMPPIYRDVFLAKQAGATTEQIMQQFNVRSPLAVANLLKSAGARIEAATKAAQGTLKPKMKDGLYDGGRPDLGYGADAPMDAIDQLRNDASSATKRRS